MAPTNCARGCRGRIIITLVNILGGLAIGVFQKGMPFGLAAQYYTLLTVGDGLVSQIPALVISTAAGIIVSRAGNESNSGPKSPLRCFSPRAISMVSAVLFGFTLIPGLPTVLFLVPALMAGTLAYALVQAKHKTEQAEEEQRARVDKATPAETLTRSLRWMCSPSKSATP
jgi:flagellar biosynthesis protein FlhA